MELESVTAKFDESRGVFLIEISTSTGGWAEGANVHKLFEDMKLPKGLQNEALEILNKSEVKIQ